MVGTSTYDNKLYKTMKIKKTPKVRGLFYFVAGSIQISNLLIEALKAISKLKDFLDSYKYYAKHCNKKLK